MTKTTLRLIGLAVLLAAAAAAGADNAAPERIVVPLSKPGQPAVIHVDLLFGAVKITGYEGKDVIVDSKATAKSVSNWPMPEPVPAPPIPGWTQDKAKEKDRKDKAAGMKRLSLDNSGLTVEEDNNTVTIEVESFRTGLDLDVKVPFNSNLKIGGANMNGISVENVNGEIEIESANGGIKLGNVSGTVVATTTNGDVDVVLNKINPDKPMSFATFNGDVDVTLPADVKATVRIKSNMGEVYSDFEIALKQAPPDTESSPKREGGKFRVSIDRSIYGTINGGGQELKFQNFHGNIYLRKKK